MAFLEDSLPYYLLRNNSIQHSFRQEGDFKTRGSIDGFRREAKRFRDGNTVAVVHAGCGVTHVLRHSPNRLDEIALAGRIGSEQGDSLEQFEPTTRDQVVQVSRRFFGNKAERLYSIDGAVVSDFDLDYHGRPPVGKQEIPGTLETWAMQKICTTSIMAHEGKRREAQFCQNMPSILPNIG